ncbi:hypothetical protein BDD12DRAFT_826707 [Trichophaea hybrida]|nr:hypothetical protein BDD12DRAFT_826707 [Trichophaea hybrida]
MLLCFCFVYHKSFAVPSWATRCVDRCGSPVRRGTGYRTGRACAITPPLFALSVCTSALPLCLQCFDHWEFACRCGIRAMVSFELAELGQVKQKIGIKRICQENPQAHPSIHPSTHTSHDHQLHQKRNPSTGSSVSDSCIPACLPVAAGCRL